MTLRDDSLAKGDGWRCYFIGRSSGEVIGCIGESMLMTRKLENVGTFVSASTLRDAARYLMCPPNPLDQEVTFSIKWHTDASDAGKGNGYGPPLNYRHLVTEATAWQRKCRDRHLRSNK